MSLDRNADPAAMAARIKELEAAQAAVPPVSPLVRLWTIGGEVLGLFPKWLLVAALAVFIAYHGYSYYMQSSRMQAENDLAAAQAAEVKARADAMNFKPDTITRSVPQAPPASEFVEPGSVLPKPAADPYRPPPSTRTK